MDKQASNTSVNPAITAVHVGYVNPLGLDWLKHHRDSGSCMQLWGASSSENSVAVYAALAGAPSDQLVPGIAIQTTYADLARISPSALWARWVGDRSECTITAREAFLAARALPAVGAIAPDSTAPDTAMLLWAMKEVLGALPERRDWLNPDAEKVMRAFVDAKRAVPVKDEQCADEASYQEVDDWLHRFIDQLADYVGACIDQSKPDAKVATVGRPRPMYQKLYDQVKVVIMRLDALCKRTAPEMQQLQGAVVAAAHKLREAGQPALAQKLEDSAAGVERALQVPTSTGESTV
jgi:hypothetical protein